MGYSMDFHNKKTVEDKKAEEQMLFTTLIYDTANVIYDSHIILQQLIKLCPDLDVTSIESLNNFDTTYKNDKNYPEKKEVLCEYISNVYELNKRRDILNNYIAKPHITDITKSLYINTAKGVQDIEIKILTDTATAKEIEIQNKHNITLNIILSYYNPTLEDEAEIQKENILVGVGENNNPVFVKLFDFNSKTH